VAPCQVVEDPGVLSFYNPDFLLLGVERLAELQDWLSPERARRLAELSFELASPGRSMLPALLQTASRGYRSGIDYDRSLSPAERLEAARRIVDALDELAVRRGVATSCVVYLPEGSDPPFEAALAGAGYQPALVGADARLEVRWPDFEGYIASFRSRRRHSIRRDVLRFERAGCTVEVGGAELLRDELAHLQAATQAKYGQRMDPSRTARWYAKVRAQLGAYARVSMARRGEDVLGIGVFYESGGELYARALGFDYGLLGAEAAYFSVTFYGPIRYAITAGLRRIHYGIEAYEAKLERGCGLHPLRGWFRFHRGDAARLRELLELHDEAQRARQEGLRMRYEAAVPD
jgi:predicted N-acyltransferase